MSEDRIEKLNSFYRWVIGFLLVVIGGAGHALLTDYVSRTEMETYVNTNGPYIRDQQNIQTFIAQTRNQTDQTLKEVRTLQISVVRLESSMALLSEQLAKLNANLERQKRSPCLLEDVWSKHDLFKREFQSGMGDTQPNPPYAPGVRAH